MVSSLQQIFLSVSRDAKDADDTEQKGALGGAEGGTNEEAKDDFAEGNENYADDSGGDKDPLGIPKYGLPDKPSKFTYTFCCVAKMMCMSVCIRFMKIFSLKLYMG